MKKNLKHFSVFIIILLSFFFVNQKTIHNQEKKEIIISRINYLNNNSNNNDTKKESTENKKLSFYKGNSETNERFNVKNMLPGDSITKYYQVKVNHKDDLDIYFDVKVTKQTKNIDEMLNIKITTLNNDEIMYDGPIKDIKENLIIYKMKKNSENETIFDLKIEVSLPTSTDNKYQNSELIADFIWYIEDEDVLIPPTGYFKNITLWRILFFITGGILVILLLRKKKGDVHEN